MASIQVNVPETRGAERFELAFEAPVRRGTSCVNVRWEDKAVFDAVRAWLSWRRGEVVPQWDVFTYLLSVALQNEQDPLHRAPVFPRQGELVSRREMRE